MKESTNLGKFHESFHNKSSLQTGNHHLDTLANREYLDEMIFRVRKKTLLFVIVTGEPLIYTMDHPDFIVCWFRENYIGLKVVKRVCAYT